MANIQGVADHANTLEETVTEVTESNMTNEREDGNDNTAGYVPVFDATVRTIVYVVTLVAGIVGLGVTAFGNPEVGAFISSAAGIIASAFGVRYVGKSI